MDRKYRWDPCISHRGDEADEFLAQYFTQVDQKILLIAGVGFDPRSYIVSTRLSKVATNMRAFLIQENRPHPRQDQLNLANNNISILLDALPNQQVKPIDIFGPDNAVVGGRNVVTFLNQQTMKGVTDVIVDISALSVGVSFPIIRYFFECIDREKMTANLHLFVIHDPCLDAKICSIASDAPGYVHGFKGGSTLFSADNVARLWLPQLTTGCRPTLERLYRLIEPHDTCPILPFPATDPRISDKLIEEYLMNELEIPWSIDAHNIVYVDEGDPLDLYRTILTLNDLRELVFRETGGSMLVLSPLGSKVMALGALMAALERDLPVAYSESIGYNLSSSIPSIIDQPNLIHLWLEGDVYPQPRRALPAIESIN